MITRMMKLLGVVILISSSGIFQLAQASDEATLGLGFATFGAYGNGAMQGVKGYSLNYESGPRKGYLRPVLTGSLMYASGTSSSLGAVKAYIGDVGLGGSLYLSKPSYCTPYIHAVAKLGWASVTGNGGASPTDSNIGLTYGISIAGGLSFRFKDDSDSKAITIGSSFNVLQSTVTTATSLTNFQIFAGVLF